MAQERLKSPRARLFVALDLPGRIRTGLEAWGAEALADPALRPVAGESLHVTLCFLGFTPEKRIEEAAEVLAAVRPRPVTLTLAPGPAGRPAKKPRLFAIQAESPAGLELQAELSTELEARHLYKPERRPFWPHVTVARVRPERGGGRRPRRVESPPGELPQELVHTFASVRVSLYRSNLRPEGAQYVSLASVNLPPGSSEPGGEEVIDEDG